MPGDADRVIFETPIVNIGAFRCAVDHPSFEDSGPARHCCFVFPRTAVAIEHENERPFAANPSVVTFYNRGQAYRRKAISPAGDRCDWFAVPAEVARDAVREFDPDVEARPEHPFRMPRGWSDPAAYLLQRQLFRRVSSARNPDSLFVEEQVMGLLYTILRATYRRAPSRRKPPPDAVHHIEAVLSQRWDQPLRLADLAKEAGLSVYHLCRTFRRLTGTSIHRYQNSLRLHSALEPLCESERPLIDIALDAGFSSHSHFTSAFHAGFGQAPSQVRRSSTILIAAG